MSKRVADMVREFHATFGLPAQDAPALVGESHAWTRQRLLLEETREVGEAVAENDLPGIAQELADVVYVAYGTALAYGIDLDAVLAEVHRANMSKLDADGKPLLREDGKVLKSALYRAPDVGAVLAGQRGDDAESEPPRIEWGHDVTLGGRTEFDGPMSEHLARKRLRHEWNTRLQQRTVTFGPWVEVPVEGGDDA